MLCEVVRQQFCDCTINSDTDICYGMPVNHNTLFRIKQNSHKTKYSKKRQPNRLRLRTAPITSRSKNRIRNNHVFNFHMVKGSAGHFELEIVAVNNSLRVGKLNQIKQTPWAPGRTMKVVIDWLIDWLIWQLGAIELGLLSEEKKSTGPISWTNWDSNIYITYRRVRGDKTEL